VGKGTGKNIIVLADGTGNSAAKLFRTNVWRVYQALDLSGKRQIAFYNDGVGTSSFKPLAIVGRAIGLGLRRNVIDLYIFLCRNYEPDDQIFGFGFSRGAFTIRVLIKFVLAKGLIDQFDSTDDLNNKAYQLYAEFRREQKKRFWLIAIGRGLRTAWSWIKHDVFRVRRPGRPHTQRVEKIRFIGLWDTVDAYGMPIHELKLGIDKYLWPLSLEDRAPYGIGKACHALSIDDKRTTFHPLLWDEKRGHPARHTDEETLTQVWFAGVHSNLGGGYPDDALSFVSLRWMIAEGIKQGLVFNAVVLEQIKAGVTPLGKIYNSRAGLGAYYRYDPRYLDPPRDNQGASIPLPKIHESVFTRMMTGTDEYAPLSLPHDFRVVKVTPEEQALKPPAAPATGKPNILEFADFMKSLDGDGRQTASIQIAQKGALDLVWDTIWWRRISYFATLAVTLCLLLYPWFPLGDTAVGQVLVFLFFPFIVALTPLAAAATPVIKLVAEAGQALLPSMAKPWINAFLNRPWEIAFVVSALVALLLLGWLLDRRIQDRASAAWRLKWQKKRYEYSLVRLALKRKLIWIGGVLAVVLLAGSIILAASLYQINAANRPCGESCQDLSIQIVYFVVMLTAVPDPRAGVPASLGQTILYLWAWLAILLPIWVVLAIWLTRARRERRKRNGIEIRSLALFVANRCRNASLVNWLYNLTAKRLIPAGFALFLVFFVVAAVNRFIFAYFEATGAICVTGAATQPLTVFGGEQDRKPRVVAFQFRDGCKHAGLYLFADRQYEVAFLPSGAAANAPNRYSDTKPYYSSWFYEPVRLLLVPFRRHIWQEWFVPIIRIGDRDVADEHEIDTRYKIIKPKRSGDLFVYVNDAILPAPPFWDLFYRANRYDGSVVVRELLPDDRNTVTDRDEGRLGL
jgi:uncharacterized protein (DUF2235 family)